VLLFLVAGVGLESLHLFKVPAYVEVAIRREMWTLAHAHGTLLGLLVVVFAGSLARDLEPTLGSRLGRWLRLGALAVPLGFFLGGVGNSEGDPSLFILLVPVGAFLLAVALWRALRATAR
jgi:hypothetical protein